MASEMTLAFDLGKASIGYCVRDEETIHELESLLIPAEFGSVSDLRPRKHAYRNRLAHHARESWFMEALWLKAGLPDYRQPTAWEQLKQRLPRYASDKKLWTREFPKNGDKTCFNSALLRIQLIEGESLADWQIWKALWAAIQKRGFFYYDWKSEPKGLESLEENLEALQAEKHRLEDSIETLKEHKKLAKGEQKQEIEEQLAADKESLKAWRAEYDEVIQHIIHYEKTLKDSVSLDEYAYPCYLDAYKQGLWECQGTQSVVKKLKIDGQAESRKKEEQLVPRAYRIKELSKLWEQAQKQLPALQQFSVQYFLFGETEKPFATAWDPQYAAKRGKAELDWQGVLGQKVPRFDNRIIAKCQLYPTRNVCKASDEANVRFSLMSQLKNLRYVDHDGVTQKPIPKEAFPAIVDKLSMQLSQQNELSFTKLTKVLDECVPDFNQFSNIGKREKLKINASGRSRFCRPALKLMNDILYYGWNPAEVDISLYIQPGVKNVISAEEVTRALARLGESWEGFSVQDRREEAFALAKSWENDKERRDKEIEAIINSSNNPIVRHRLWVFKKLLDELSERYGLLKDKPKRVILEFARGVDSGFEGKRQAEDYERAITRNEKLKDELTQKLTDIKVSFSHRNLERLRLLEEQNGICPYTGGKLEESLLMTYEVDHIVPMSEEIHSDALWNKVLVLHSANQEKRDRTPYEWLYGTPRWEEFIQRVQAIYVDGPKKKKQLLLSETARALVKSYNGLAETSYIARLVQQIVALYFAFPIQNKDENRYIFVNDGAITEAIRRKYDLNDWLFSSEELAERERLQAELQNTPYDEDKKRFELRKRIRDLLKKNRKNDKHHALDAFCISLSQSIHREKATLDRPEGYWCVANMEKFKPQAKSKLGALFPKTIRRNTKELYPEESIYRYNPQANAMTIRRGIDKVLKDEKALAKVLDPKLREELKLYLNQLKEKYPDSKAFQEALTKRSEAYLHYRYKSPVLTVETLATELGEQPTKTSKGCLSASEYKDYSSKLTRGQFKRTKQHKGQLLYKDSKGKWRVYPVYGYMKLKDAQAELLAKGFELYGGGCLFYSSATVMLPQSAKGGQVPPGLYKLRTIMSAGTAKIESQDGQEIILSVKEMAEAGCQVI